MEHSKAKGDHPIHNWKADSLPAITGLVAGDLDKVALVAGSYHRLESINPTVWVAFGGSSEIITPDDQVNGGKVKFTSLPTMAFNPATNYGATNLDNSFHTQLMSVGSTAKMIKSMAGSDNQAEIAAIKKTLNSNDVNFDDLQEHVDMLKALKTKDTDFGTRLQGVEDTRVKKSELFAGGVIQEQYLAKDVFIINNSPITINKRTGQFINNTLVTGALINADPINMVDDRQHTIRCLGGTITVTMEGATQNTDDTADTTKVVSLVEGDQMLLVKAELSAGNNVNVIIWSVAKMTPEVQAQAQTQVQTQVQEVQQFVAPPSVSSDARTLTVSDMTWIQTGSADHLITLTDAQYADLPEISLEVLDEDNTANDNRVTNKRFSKAQLATDFQYSNYYKADVFRENKDGISVSISKRPPNQLQISYVDIDGPKSGSFGKIRGIHLDGVPITTREIQVSPYGTVGVEHRPDEGVPVTSGTLATGHDFTAGDRLELIFKDTALNGGRLHRSITIDLIGFRAIGKGLGNSHVGAYFKFAIGDERTGSLEVIAENRDVIYIASRMYRI